MYARTFGEATQGVDGLIISVEVDSANGMPAFDIVGLPSTAVRESKERVRTAIKNSSLRMRAEKITINLAPASVKKEHGSRPADSDNCAGGKFRKNKRELRCKIP